MENPLEYSKPTGMIEQIHAFARDYAYGFVNDYWEQNFRIRAKHYEDETLFELEIRAYDTNQLSKFHQKWGELRASFLTLLTQFDYFNNKYEIMPKGLALLEQPAIAPNIFISYGRKQSSAFSLLVEARLKIVDSQIGVFVDKSIPLGNDWHGHLEERVKQSKYFICLLGQVLTPNGSGSSNCITTISSPYVRKEIKWALDAGSTIIFVCHNGYRLPSTQDNLDDETWSIIQALGTKQGIFIDKESAEEYEFAVMKLLNGLGYSTY